MICLNCKKQIPDNSASCPFCGNQIIHKEQLPEEIKFRRYQRWAFYAIISIMFLGMTGLTVKIYNANSANLVRLANIDQKFKQRGVELDQAKLDISAKEKLIKETQDNLVDKEKKMQEVSSTLQQTKDELSKKNEELTKKTDDYKTVLDEQMSIKEKNNNCAIGLASADANIYSLIIKLGVGVSNKDIAKIPVADSNLGVGTDSDSDGLSDAIETAIGTNLNKADTDGDGFNDKKEVLGGFNPFGKGNTAIDNGFSNRLKGKILLQVEGHGEAWYVSPSDGKRYFLGSPANAFRVMRDLNYWTKDWLKDHKPAIDTTITQSTSQTVSSDDSLINNTVISTSSATSTN